MRLCCEAMPPPSSGTDGRQLSFQMLYMCADGCDLALGLRSHDREIALSSRVSGRAHHIELEIVRKTTFEAVKPRWRFGAHWIVQLHLYRRQLEM
jgi:hypothetical protein